MADSSILIKLGGTAATNAVQLEMLARELATVSGPIAIVHGGGKEVSDVSRRFGLEPIFHEGIRMTSEEEMDVVEMILCGLANKRLVRRLLRAGVNAVGISGADAGMVTGERITDARGAPSRTAKVASLDASLVRDLWGGGYVPVIASPASDAAGEAVNINADDIAFSLAGALGVGSLLFLSDVAGVLIDGEPVSSLTPAMASAQIAGGEISGGMIPKVQNAMTAIETGVAQVVIGSYERRGHLKALLEGSRGTAIIPGDET